MNSDLDSQNSMLNVQQQQMVYPAERPNISPIKVDLTVSQKLKLRKERLKNENMMLMMLHQCKGRIGELEAANDLLRFKIKLFIKEGGVTIGNTEKVSSSQRNSPSAIKRNMHVESPQRQTHDIVHQTYQAQCINCTQQLVTGSPKKKKNQESERSPIKLPNKQIGDSTASSRKIEKLTNKIMLLNNTLNNLIGGFKRREDSLKHQVASHKAGLQELYAAHQKLRLKLKDACHKVCDQLAVVENYSEASGEQSEAVQYNSHIVAQLVSRVVQLENEKIEQEFIVDQLQSTSTNNVSKTSRQTSSSVNSGSRNGSRNSQVKQQPQHQQHVSSASSFSPSRSSHNYAYDALDKDAEEDLIASRLGAELFQRMNLNNSGGNSRISVQSTRNEGNSESETDEDDDRYDDENNRQQYCSSKEDSPVRIYKSNSYDQLDDQKGSVDRYHDGYLSDSVLSSASKSVRGSSLSLKDLMPSSSQRNESPTFTAIRSTAASPSPRVTLQNIDSFDAQIVKSVSGESPQQSPCSTAVTPSVNGIASMNRSESSEDRFYYSNASNSDMSVSSQYSHSVNGDSSMHRLSPRRDLPSPMSDSGSNLSMLYPHQQRNSTTLSLSPLRRVDSRPNRTLLSPAVGESVRTPTMPFSTYSPPKQNSNSGKKKSLMTPERVTSGEMVANDRLDDYDDIISEYQHGVHDLLSELRNSMVKLAKPMTTISPLYKSVDGWGTVQLDGVDSASRPVRSNSWSPEHSGVDMFSMLMSTTREEDHERVVGTALSFDYAEIASSSSPKYDTSRQKSHVEATHGEQCDDLHSSPTENQESSLDTSNWVRNFEARRSQLHLAPIHSHLSGNGKGIAVHVNDSACLSQEKYHEHGSECSGRSAESTPAVSPSSASSSASFCDDSQHDVEYLSDGEPCAEIVFTSEEYAQHDNEEDGDEQEQEHAVNKLIDANENTETTRCTSHDLDMTIEEEYNIKVQDEIDVRTDSISEDHETLNGCNEQRNGLVADDPHRRNDDVVMLALPIVAPITQQQLISNGATKHTSPRLVTVPSTDSKISSSAMILEESLLVTDLKLQLYFCRQELAQSKQVEARLSQQNKTLQEERQRLLAEVQALQRERSELLQLKSDR